MNQKERREELEGRRLYPGRYVESGQWDILPNTLKSYKQELHHGEKPE
jgi:hypothetical protein